MSSVEMSSGDIGLAGLPRPPLPLAGDATASRTYGDGEGQGSNACTKSRSLSLQTSVVRALPLTRVPLRTAPRSRTTMDSPLMVNSACSRLTCSRCLAEDGKVCTAAADFEVGPDQGNDFPLRAYLEPQPVALS